MLLGLLSNLGLAIVVLHWLERLVFLLLFNFVLLLGVEHFAGLDVAHVAFVANVSESEVVVAAPLAGPVANSLGGLLEAARAEFSWGNLLHCFPKGVFIKS